MRRLDCRAYYFLHIPKTAGTSLISLLDAQFSHLRTCPAQLWHQLLALPSDTWNDYDFFRGHLYTYLHRFLKKELDTIVFLRDPIERSLSHYAHVLRESDHYCSELANLQKSFEAFLDDPRTAPLISNFQTRSLTLDLDPSLIAKFCTQEEIQHYKVEQILECAAITPLREAEVLSKAKSFIDNCLFVGITERYTESIDLLAKQLQFSSVRYDRIRVGANRCGVDTLPKSVMRKLESHLQLDFEIYDYAYARLRSELPGSIRRFAA